MPTREFTVTNKLGIHARPAAQFVKTASKFSCDIQVEKDDEQADGKSIMGLMMLAAGNGSVLIVTTDGDDDELALDAIGSLIEKNFEE
ncbi:MAG TPA: HPr family phosphocarrier protein [Verrucomicrobiales bacterium]|jgi:phosphocarrier protein|nr:HPr family phosphocarrier protein [Verrucomicrobiales bacterium]HCI91592.1 HPr family phosphocarrier protein [Verrucomicrobiales bacterium]HCL96293.1 HPr family phosphocarrier protein [Verrucomicrobiales bacterium]